MRRVTTLLLTALLTGACVVDQPFGAGSSTTLGAGDPTPPVVIAHPFALQTFPDCDEVLSYLKANALERVTPWGLDGMPWFGGFLEGDVARSAETTPGAATPGVDYSTTNLQELGVDEPDIVKTDGRRLLAVAQGRLFVVDVTGTAPVLLGSLFLESGWNHQLFFAGDTALVMASDQGVMPLGGVARETILPWWGSPTTTITQIDLSNPSSPLVVRTLRLDGTFVSARMTGTTARLVITSFPTGLEFVVPEGGGLRNEREALAENRRIITESRLEDWMPYYVLEDNEHGTTTEGTLLDCGRVAKPAEFSGLSTLSILTIDLAGGIRPADSFGLVADGSTVYGSTNSLYVATQRWIDWARIPAVDLDATVDQVRSVIHRFDISDPAVTIYRASGDVPGYLLSQWSMSEHEGFLRVASTTESPWVGFQAGRTESMVTVLEEVDGRLVTAGQVAGLGKDERIYAVRFIDEVGYVVTFRQTDPLFTIDLSEPTSPRVAGELKIPGYSAYLHPIGDGLLLGVGQDADDQGRVKGTQVAVFDVSDAGLPRQIHKMTLANGSSEVEWDHHAFLYWEGLTVIPVQTWSPDGKWFAGAMVLEAGREGIAELSRLSHGDPQFSQAPIRRSVVVGDTLFTVSDLGILASQIDTLSQTGWLQF